MSRPAQGAVAYPSAMALREWRTALPEGEIVVTLEDDGTVSIDSPACPEIITIWKLSEAFADELVWYGVERQTALDVYRDFDAHRPN
jgi:hypothetical protein